MAPLSSDGNEHQTKHRTERHIMKVYTIAETLAIQPGTPITAVSGIVTRVHQPAMGTGKFGPYHLQRVDIEDGGSTTTLNLDGHDDIHDDAVGHRIYAIAGTGKGGSSVGLKASVYTSSTGQSYPRIDVKKSATLSWNPPEGATTATPQPRPATPQATSAPAPAPRSYPATPTTTAPDQSAPAHGGQSAHDWGKIDAALNRLRRLRLRAIQCTQRIAKDADAAGVTLTPERIGAIETWLCISMERMGMVVHVPNIDPPGIGAEPARASTPAPTPAPAPEPDPDVDDVAF